MNQIVGTLALLLTGLAARGWSQQETGFLNRTMTIGSRTVRYQVYVPADFTPDKEWPVILFLHGAGDRGADGISQTQVGLGAAIRQHPSRFPAIVVLPQAPADSVWRGSVLDVALAALERSVKEFRGDRMRLYLTGLSMGGYGSWTLALTRPALFAAIVAVCGGVPPPSHFILKDLDLGNADRYAALARRLAGTPVWLFHGAEDSVVSSVESRRIHAAFHKAGSRANYTEYPGVGHNSWDPAFSDPLLWQWLFEQRRRPQ